MDPLTLALAGGAAAYYFLVLKPKQTPKLTQGGSAVMADLARLHKSSAKTYNAVVALSLGSPTKKKLISAAQQMFTAGYPALANDLAAKAALL